METDTTTILTDTNTLVFKKMTIADIPSLREFFTDNPSRSCDFTLGGTLMWSHYFDYHFCLTGDALIIRGTSPDTGETIFYAHTVADAESGVERDVELQIREYCRRNSINGTLLRSEFCIKDAEEDHRPDPIDHIEEWKEYIYDIEKFTGFAGKKMEKKRNHLNFFRNHYPQAVVREITPADAERLILFTKKFALTHESNALFDYEEEQTIEVLRHYADYGFDGIMIEADGEVIGYSFGETYGDTFFAHVEKGNIAYRGIYQALASNMARLIHDRYPAVRYINREEDMGEETLRQSKNSYHPIGFVLKRMLPV